MSGDVRINQDLMNMLYQKYKAYLIPFGVICACVVIFLLVIIPQIQLYFSNADVVQSDRDTIQRLENNKNALNLLQEADIDKNLAITQAALPTDKDFVGILNAISKAASVANVGLGDYTFQVGDVFGKSNVVQNGQLTIQINLTLTGNLAATQKFIDTLGAEFPLSEMVAINNRGDNGSDITAVFFYKPFNNASFDPSASLPVLSPADQKLLTTLGSNFQKPTDVAIPKKEIASDSAELQQ